MKYTGCLRLSAERKGERTILADRYCDGVLKVTRPVYTEGGIPLLTMIHVGGGFVDGDRYYTEVTVGESAQLGLTTQASTKVYKSRGEGASQEMDLFLQKGSELYVRQDSLIPYQESDFSQTIHVYMDSSAVFFYSETITPGWSEDGGLFQYQRVRSKMKIFLDGTLEVFDHLLLEPDEKLAKILYLEGYTHIGTVYFLHPQLSDELIDGLKIKLKEYNGLRIGVSRLNCAGIAIRILGNNTPSIERAADVCEAYFRDQLGSAEKLEWRKY